MRPPLPTVRLPDGAAADVQVVDAAVVGLAAALCYLAAVPVVRLLRAPVQGRVDAGDLTDLGLAVYADSVVLVGPRGNVRVLADPQAPTATRPGVVLRGVVPAEDWLPGTTHPSDVGAENLTALAVAVDGLVETLTETLHLGAAGG